MAARAVLRAGLRSELALVALGLALVATLVYGDHVARGGFIWDDWENAGTTRYGYQDGFLGPFDLRQAAYRPLLALLIPLPHLAFGADPAPHLALGLAIAVAAAATFYALLRAAGVPRVYAVAAAALALLFPWSSSTRLWATATLNLVAVALVAGAATISLRRLAERGGDPRARVALTAVLCAAAVLTYEAVSGIVLLLPALYRLRAPWRAVLARWRFEVLAGGAATLLVALTTTKREFGGTAALEQAARIARDGAELTGRALAPWPGVPAGVGVTVAAAVVAAALALRRPGARGAAIAVGLSLLALALSWAPLVPAEAKYVPSGDGIYDRVNIVAGFALAALVTSLAATASTLVPGSSAARVALPAAIVVLVGGGWIAHVREAVDDYRRSAVAQRADMAAIDAAFRGPPPRGAVVVLFHDSSWAGPGVPGFAHPWDLTPALKLRFADASLTGFPIAPDTRVECGPRALEVDAVGTDDPPPAPYARAVLVEGRSGEVVHVGRANECRAAVARLRSPRASA